MKNLKRLRIFFSFLYALNAYAGCEEISLWDRIYHKRIGVGTAWAMAKIVHP